MSDKKTSEPICLGVHLCKLCASVIEVNKQEIIEEFLEKWKLIGNYISDDNIEGWTFWDNIDNDYKKRLKK